jgi:hypothetical protein
LAKVGSSASAASDAADPEKTDHKSLSASQRIDAGTLRLRLVGQEPGALVLFAWTNACLIENATQARTFIECYNLETRERSQLYSRPGIVDVLNATTNNHRNLLSFTVWRSFASTGAVLYETYLVTCNQSGRAKELHMHQAREHVQRSQFIGDDNDHTSHLIFWSHTECIQLFTIRVINKANRASVIESCTHEPVHGAFMWYQWDFVRRKLFLLAVKRGGDLKPQFVLKALSFTIKHRPSLDFETPIPLQVLFNSAS